MTAAGCQVLVLLVLATALGIMLALVLGRLHHQTPALGRSDADRVGERSAPVRSGHSGLDLRVRAEAPHRVPRTPIEGGLT